MRADGIYVSVHDGKGMMCAACAGHYQRVQVCGCCTWRRAHPGSQEQYKISS